MAPPPAAIRFAYEGADPTEAAVLHGLAAAYEGLFRLESERRVNGRPCYRHVARRDKFVAFSGRAWMAQGESSLGSERGVMMLRDANCTTPDRSGAQWKLTPGWVVEPGLRCIGMSEAEAARWEMESNPWEEGRQANEAIDQISGVLRGAPPEDRAEMMAQLKSLEARVMDELGLADDQTPGRLKPPKPPSSHRLLKLRGGLFFVGVVDSKGRVRSCSACSSEWLRNPSQ
ncbi:MAG: hypothetical protein SGPRY_000810 [Prymnesium sp.]